MEKTGCVATIGMFDGVHLGHQFVLRQVVEEAHRRGLQSLAVTFDRQQPLLTPINEKVQLIAQVGIDRVEVLPFTEELKMMTAFQFMQQVLKEQLGVKVLFIGYDNRFGHNREEGFDDYVRHGRLLGIEVLQLPAKGTVCSSHIRQYLQEGRVAEAAASLSYPYTLIGHVMHGEHVGTTLGFPTANLVLDDEHQIVPAPGVYAVKVRLENGHEDRQGMMNIGTRPTFDGRQQTLEVHVFQLHENLYGQQLAVSFVERLREEHRFDTVEALRQQLQQDEEQAKELFQSIKI